MQVVECKIVGLSPLLMNSDAGVDTTSAISKAISKITKKKSGKTEAEAEQVNRLCWERAMYFDDELGPYIPSWNVWRAIQDGARFRKQGKTIERGLHVECDAFRLDYEGPRDIEGMYRDGRFLDIRSIKQGTSRVMRARPKFRDWTLRCSFVIDAEALNVDAFFQAAEDAGRFAGIGDYRPRYGRFTVERV